MGQRRLTADPDYKFRWRGKRLGRYFKRQLSKARRQQAKLVIAGDYRRAHSITWAESTCNYKAD